MSASVAAVVMAALILILTIELLRRRQLREKYAALWLFVSIVGVVLALAPGLLTRLAAWLGFGVPANLLFFAGFILLLVIAMQLSLELGRREDETERLAEEVALLRNALATLEGKVHERARRDGSDDRDG